MLPCFFGGQGIIGIQTDQTEFADIGIIVCNTAVSDGAVRSPPDNLAVIEQRCNNLHAVCRGFQLMVSVNTVYGKSMRILKVCMDQFRRAAVIVAEVAAMDDKRRTDICRTGKNLLQMIDRRRLHAFFIVKIRKNDKFQLLHGSFPPNRSNTVRAGTESSV